MSKEFPNEPALIADLKATFPGLMVRPIREFGRQGFDYGAWIGGSENMPDGIPIFDSLRHYGDSEDPADGEYDGGVNTGFSAWLGSRGWYLENYDGETFFAIPILQAQAGKTEAAY